MIKREYPFRAFDMLCDNGRHMSIITSQTTIPELSTIDLQWNEEHTSNNRCTSYFKIMFFKKSINIFQSSALIGPSQKHKEN